VTPDGGDDRHEKPHLRLLDCSKESIKSVLIRTLADAYKVKAGTLRFPYQFAFNPQENIKFVGSFTNVQGFIRVRFLTDMVHFK
jgi:hypothetical protein